LRLTITLPKRNVNTSPHFWAKRETRDCRSCHPWKPGLCAVLRCVLVRTRAFFWPCLMFTTSVSNSKHLAAKLDTIVCVAGHSGHFVSPGKDDEPFVGLHGQIRHKAAGMDYTSQSHWCISQATMASYGPFIISLWGGDKVRSLLSLDRFVDWPFLVLAVPRPLSYCVSVSSNGYNSESVRRNVRSSSRERIVSLSSTHMLQDPLCATCDQTLDDLDTSLHHSLLPNLVAGYSTLVVCTRHR